MTIGKWRRLAAFVILGLFVFAFLVPGAWTDTLRRIELWTQFSPHITHFGVGVLIALAILFATALIGRFYCSLLCPAGLLQELFHRLGGLLKLRRLSCNAKSHPLVLLLVVAATALLGFVSLLNLLDPLGLFGRLVTAPCSSIHDTTLLIAVAVGIVLLVVVPLFRGRWFCDRLCPVGGLLGLAAGVGERGVFLNAEKCVSCGRCEKICPVRAADATGKRIDASRCVLCMDCLDKCPVGALTYLKREPEARRGFLQTFGALSLGTICAFVRPLAAGFGLFPHGTPDIVPPGSRGYDQHRQRCVSCQSCVQACPVGIIQLKGADLRPVLDYDRGYCQYGCDACTQSCPAGALLPVPLGQKQVTRLARTKLDYDRCVTIVEGQACGACAEVCPTHAVRMVEQGNGMPTAPDFDAKYCIGCGACYHVCPAEPRAFVLEGLHVHETAEGVRPGGHSDGEKSAEKVDYNSEPPDFPF